MAIYKVNLARFLENLYCLRTNLQKEDSRLSPIPSRRVSLLTFAPPLFRELRMQ